MAPVIMSVAMFSLMMMIDVVQCTTIADEAHEYAYLNNAMINKANVIATQWAKPDEYYIGSNKEYLIEQIRARISMTQPTIDELTKLYNAKFGDITKERGPSKEFDPDDQEKADQLLDKLKESHVWFGNLLRLSNEQDQLKKYYSQVEAYEKLLQEGYEMLSRSPKLASQRPYLDSIKMELNKVKQDFDKGKQFFGHELDILNADMVEHNLGSRFRKDQIYSDYGNVEFIFKRFLMEMCENLIKKLLLAESVNDESDKEKPQDDEKAKQNSASISASNSSGSQENQEDPPKVFPPTDIPEPGSQVNLEDLKLTPPVIPIRGGTQSTQEDQRPFWKKKRYNIPASLGGLVFTGWLLDLHNKIPQMIWGSKENDASTKVNPPNSTTTDTSTDATTHQVEYLTVVIIVLVVLVLLAVGFVVLFKRCKNGTSDLERGEASHKNQAASNMTSTATGTEIPLTPTRSTNATSSKAKSTPEAVSKKDSPGTASTPVSTKTKSKRSSQK